jgi:predicted regulator of Ras-like GTPase activity (Roadblock/LC7/MglB family)
MDKQYISDTDGQRTYIFTPGQLSKIEEVLTEDLLDVGVHSVTLIDMAGNIISTMDNGENKHDIYSLAALAAGNFGAVSTMAGLIGEEEFSLLFHKGKKENIHFSKVTDEFLLITIFGKEVSLGFLRLKVAEATEKLMSGLDPGSERFGVPFRVPGTVSAQCFSGEVAFHGHHQSEKERGSSEDRLLWPWQGRENDQP